MALINRGKRLRLMPQVEYQNKLKAQIFRFVDQAEADACWRWTGAKQLNGYGQTRVLGKQTPAHRASYIAFVGPVPTGLEVCHRCDVRDCVNPAHLFAATHQENMRDQKQKGRARNGVMSGAYLPVRDSHGKFVPINQENT